MATPKDIIEILRADYGSLLKEERIISIINALELRLSKEVLRKREIAEFYLAKNETKIILPFSHELVLKVASSGKEVKRQSAFNKSGYIIKNNEIIFSKDYAQREITIEYLSIPQPFSISDYSKREIIIPSEYIDIYVYPIISKEALLNDDIDRVNNFSALYVNALKQFISSVNPEVSEKFKNIW